MKVLFVTNIPSPYRVVFFNELGRYCELTVLFEKNASDERDKSWKDFHFDTFSGIIMNGKSISVDMSFCPEVTSYVRNKKWDVIICSDFLSPTGMKLTAYLKRHHISYILESDGGVVGSDNFVKRAIKTKAIKGADWYLSTGKTHDDYYAAYGAERNRILRYPFSSVKKKDILEKPITPLEKAENKKRIGITEEFVVLAVGQFIFRKGFDILLRASLCFPENVGVYIVGGEPTEEYLSIKEQNGLGHVHFLGFKNPMELKEYYDASDVFVLPTRGDIWGLVINEAMANALPIITTDRCLAGVEMIADGENGFLIPCENENAIISHVNQLIDDEDYCRRIAENNIRKAHQYTIETMVQAHIDLFERVKKG